MDEADLAKYAELLNEYGVNSAEAEAFFAIRADDEEFVRLARLSRRLKLALTPGSETPVSPASNPDPLVQKASRGASR